DAAPLHVPDGGVVNATVIPTASVSAMLNPRGLPPYTGETGGVEGTISVVGDPPIPTPDNFSKCPSAEETCGVSCRQGKVTNAQTGAHALADAIVAVTGYKGFYVPEQDEEKTITIEGCAYTTRTITMTYGQRIEIKNMSRDFWVPILEPGYNQVS